MARGPRRHDQPDKRRSGYAGEHVLVSLRPLVLLLVVLVAAGVASACGDDSDGAVASGGTSTSVIEEVCCGNPNGAVEEPDAVVTNFNPLSELNGAVMFLATHTGCAPQPSEPPGASESDNESWVERQSCRLSDDGDTGTFSARRWPTPNEAEEAFASLSDESAVCFTNGSKGRHSVFMRVDSVIFGGSTESGSSPTAADAMARFSSAVRGRPQVSDITCP